MNNSMNPFAPVWSSLVGLRNWIYDQKIIEPIQLPIPVISVGNITMGGTGKTPFIQWLLHELIRMGYHPGVISRNYGVNNKNSGFVTLGIEASSIFGDEAVLLKMKNPDIPIYSGPQKWKSALKVVEEAKSVDVLLIDDGFQHRRLKRDFDILLLDTSVKKRDYEWPPRGRARESFIALKRASAIIFTKCEQSNAETLAFLEKKCSSIDYYQTQTQSIKPLMLRAEQKQGNPQWVRGKPLISQNIIKEGRGLAFCGLGNPESFLQGLKNQGLTIGAFKVFADHFQYDKKSIQSLIELSINYDYLVTSEKDFVKVMGWPDEGPPLCVVSLEYQMSGDLEGFRAKLARHLGKNH